MSRLVRYLEVIRLETSPTELRQWAQWLETQVESSRGIEVSVTAGAIIGDGIRLEFWWMLRDRENGEEQSSGEDEE